MNLLRPKTTFGWPQTVTIVIALVLLPVSAVVRSDEPVAPSIEQQPLFEAGKDGYFNYRIPSLVVTSRGTVLALCEARKKTGHDWDDVDLALRRSTDHGRTWSKMQIIADEGELTINQPCPVFDHQTGTIWLPLCRGRKPGLGNAEVLLMKSTDDGQTWSRPVSIHQTAADPSWTFVGTGPGHGIQLKSGRLLIPCWFDVTPTCGEVQSSCCIYSDDHGVTWKRGEPLTRNASDECDIVELEDGTVYLNARSRGQKQRAYAFSKDGGQNWSAVKYDPLQPEPSCDGALIRLSDSRRSDKNRVLVACPTNPDTRAHIRVRMSYDECQTWPIASEPLAHLGGYSDLAVTGDRQVLCLYETWPSYKEFGENRTNLVLAKFNVEWLSGGQDTIAAPGKTWSAHEVRQLGEPAGGDRTPAKLQIVTESWNRVVAVPYIVYMPEKDRLLMLVSCDYPHRPMVLTSDDQGANWSKPQPVLPDEPAHARHLLGVSLTYLGDGQLLCGVEGKLRCRSVDYGQTWSSEPIPPNSHGGGWNQWDPYLVDRDAATGKVTQVIETGYRGSTDGGQEAFLRSSRDLGKTWKDATRVPQWAKVSEAALARAANGHIVAACRTDIPPSKQGETLDHFEGLGVSISTDEGRTWSEVRKLFDWGRHHPSLVVMPTGDIVMTYVVRKGYIDTEDGFPQFGIEAVISRDHGRTWDLDHRNLLHTWVGNRKGSNQSAPGPQAWWASSQATSTVLLPDGNLLTAFGTGYRSQPNAQGMSSPRDVGLIQWRLSKKPSGKSRRIRDAAPDSDLRNWLDPRTGQPALPAK